MIPPSPSTGRRLGLAAACLLAFASVSLAGGVDFTPEQANGETRLVVTTSFYRAVLAPGRGAQLLDLRARDARRGAAAFFMDFDARMGPPGWARKAYSYRIVENVQQRLVVRCTLRMSEQEYLVPGQVWRKTFIFRADTPTIRMVAEVSKPKGAAFAAYAARGVIPFGGADAANAFFMVGSGEKWEVIEMAEAMAEPKNWLTLKPGSVIAAVDRDTGEGVALWARGPAPRSALLCVDAVRGRTFLDVSYPLQAVGKSPRRRIVLELTPLAAARSPKDVQKQCAAYRFPEPEPRQPKAAPAAAPAWSGREAAVRRILLVCAPAREGLYGVESVMDTLPFPLEVTKAFCVRGAYWPGENEFIKGLPASDAEWSRFAAAIFVDTPGWAFTKGDGERLRRFVNAGGSLVFLGDQGRGYRNTAVGDLIPLKIPYAERSARDEEGREFLKDRSPWTRLTLSGSPHPAIRGLPRTAMPVTVVHQAAPGGGADVLATAGGFPALVVKSIGKGRVVSMPIALTPKPDTDAAAPAALSEKSAKLDGSLTRWPFYDDLWRQLMIWLCGDPPKVFFSTLAAPDERTLTAPRSVMFEYEIASRAQEKRKVAVHIEFWRDGRKVKALHAERSFELAPGQSVGQQSRVDLPAERGRYRYVISLRDDQNRTLDWRDGEFDALPAMFLETDLGPVPAFPAGSQPHARVVINHIKTEALRVEARVVYESGRPAAPPAARTLRKLSLAKLAVDFPLNAAALRPGRYRLQVKLYAGKKLDKLVDAQDIPFSMEPPAGPRSFSIVLGGLFPPSADQTAQIVKAALDLKADSILLPEVLLDSPGFESLGGQRTLGLIRHAIRRGLGLVGGIPGVRGLLSARCPSAIAAEGLPEETRQAVERYVRSRRQVAGYAAVSFVPERVPGAHEACDACRRFFKAKFGYDMPGPDSLQRYYYARCFMGDSLVGALVKMRECVMSQTPPWRALALVDPESYFTGACDPAAFARAFDELGLTRSPAAPEGRLWLEAARAAMKRPDQQYWAAVDVLPRPGAAWEPWAVGAQAYEALGRGARGVCLRAFQQGLYDLGDAPACRRAAMDAMEDMRVLGPAFAHLKRRPSRAALLYPWASFALGDPRTIIHFLAEARDVLETAAGSAEIVHETTVTDASALAKYKVLVAAETRCVPIRLARAIEQWVRAGGILVVIGEAGVVDERNMPSLFPERVLGLRYGERVSAAVEGLSERRRRGRKLKPMAGSHVMLRYAGGAPAAVVKDFGASGVVTLGFLPTAAEFREIMEDWLPSSGEVRSPDPELRVFTLTDGKSGALYVVAVNPTSVFKETVLLPPAGVGWPSAFDLHDGAALRLAQRHGELSIPLKLERGQGRAIVLLESPPKKLAMKVSVRDGVIHYEVAATDAAGRPARYTLPVQLVFIQPDGEVKTGLGGWKALVGGALKGSVTLPYDCAKGKWTALARLSVGDLSAKQPFDIE